MHAKVIKYLFFSSTVVAILVAAFTFFIQMNTIETKVLSLAKSEVKYFIREYEVSDRENDEELNISQRNFLWIRVLDNHKKIILEKAVDNIKNILADLKKIDHHLVTQESETFKQTIIHNQIKNSFYLKFKAPVVLENFKGNMEGLYEVSDDEMKKVYTSIFYSILQLVITVFTTTLLLYPVIIYFNRAYITTK